MASLLEDNSAVQGPRLSGPLDWMGLLHPVLFAAAPILSLFARNAGDVQFGQAGWVMLAAVGVAVLLTAVYSLIYRGVVRGALMASLSVVLFFMYGYGFDAVRSVGWIKSYAAIHGLVGCVFSALLAGGAIAVWRSRRDLAVLSRGLTFMAAVLVALPLVKVSHGVLFQSARKQDRKHGRLEQRGDAANGMAPERVRPILHHDPSKPDVYYLVLDGYARADMLRAIYGFDNSAFINGLKARGFHVVEDSLANYAYTHLSLSSSLNMNYMEEVVKRFPPGGRGLAPAYRAIRDPLVARHFQSRGYRYVHFATNWGGTEDSDRADVIFRARPKWLQQEFMEVLIRTTALRLFEPNVSSLHLYQFRTLRDVPAMGGPKFVFAHFLVPHKPYVFDRLGNIRRDVPLALQWRTNDGGWQNRQAYVDQLQHVNTMILESIDAILAKSKSRPWIVLQSDHGTAAMQSGRNLTEEDPEQQAFIRERLANFTALLAPDEKRVHFPRTISPVNIFRIVLNDLFQTGFELLPDRHYMGSRRERFREVGDIARLGGLDPDFVRKVLDANREGVEPAQDAEP